MKIYRLLLFALLTCFAISCSQDTYEDQEVENQTTDDFNQRHAAGEFDLSFRGIYKGLFTTNDGLTRGTLLLTLSKKNEAIAQITLSSGEIIEFQGTGKFSDKNITKTINFSTVGISSISSSFDFSVENNGTLPSVSNLIFDNKESNILIAKELARAPLNMLTGTYERTSGGGNFAESGRTWNIMSIGAGNLTYSTQIFYEGNIYNSTNNGAQDNCVDGGNGSTICDVDGTATVAGVAVSWTGTHFYDNFDDNLGCSEFSGTWAAPSYANSVGTYISDSTCDNISIVNDVCDSATSIGLDETAFGDINGSTNIDSPDFCDEALAGTADGNGVWYTFTSPDDLDIQIDTNGSALDTQIRLFSGTCDSLVCIENDDDDGDGLDSLINLSATSGETYYIYVGGYNANEDTFQLNITDLTPPPVLDFELNLTCGDFMVDNGTNLSNYSINSFDTYVIDAGVGNSISLVFSEFNTENNWDFVRVYDGADNTAPYITMSVGGNSTLDLGGERYGFTGTGANSLVDDSVASTGQFMTVEFYSDGSITRSGFVAEVICSNGRVDLGKTKTSLTYNPTVDMSRSVTKQTEIKTVKLRKGEMKTEAYYLSQQQ